MTKIKETGKVKSPKLLYRRGIIFFISVIGVGLLYYFTSKNEQAEVTDLPKIINSSEIISTHFNENLFSEGTETSLLQEIGVCDSMNQNSNLIPCSPNLFRFFKLNHKKSLKDGFILLINSDIYREANSVFAPRRILIYQRERGRLVNLNIMNGDIIEMRVSNNSGYKDLIIRFRHPKFNDEAYHCLFEWKKGRYQFSRCEKLFSFYNKSGNFRKEMIDSVSWEVENILVKENLVN